MMRNVSFIVILVMSVFVACSAFATSSLEWYTPGSGEDVLYTDDGNPGEGTESLSGISGASSWYAMVYDVSLFDVTEYDFSEYASPELARDDVMAAELFGGAYITIDSPTSVYIYRTFIGEAQVTPFSNKDLGAVVFNTDDPNAADLSGMMFAYSTTTFDAVDLVGGNDPEVYQTSTLGFGESEWKAVPEPVSAMIAFLGVPVLVLARRRFNKK